MHALTWVSSRDAIRCDLRRNFIFLQRFRGIQIKHNQFQNTVLFDNLEHHNVGLVFRSSTDTGELISEAKAFDPKICVFVCI